MKKMALFLIIPFTLLLGIQTANAQENTTAPANTHMKASSQRSASAASTMWNSFKPETLTGTISMIEPGQKEIFLSGSNGASFEFKLTPRTKIQIGGERSTIAQLAERAQNKATVTFVARPKGDIAHSITVSS